MEVGDDDIVVGAGIAAFAGAVVVCAFIGAVVVAAVATVDAAGATVDAGGDDACDADVPGMLVACGLGATVGAGAPGNFPGIGGAGAAFGGPS